MQTHVTASGQLMHHFHGDYWASIGLRFASYPHALDAQRALGEDHWELRCNDVACGAPFLVWKGNSEALEALKAQLEPYLRPRPCYSFGCQGETHEIDSLAHSVDYGPPFDLDIPTTPHEQTALAL